jgi:2-oxoglutarate dehydrogenase E2 component (dihydrolipoamide succinyltransferase)
MVDVAVPQLGESVTEGTITKWLVKEGDFVTKDQPLAEIATDKADSELPAPTGGRVVKLLAKEGDVVPVRTVICQLDETAKGTATSSATPASHPTAAPHVASPPVTTKSDQPVPPSGGNANDGRAPMATPTARRAALEAGVDLREVRGSDRGRITRDDVMRASVDNDLPPRTEPPMSPALRANAEA